MEVGPEVHKRCSECVQGEGFYNQGNKEAKETKDTRTPTTRLVTPRTSGSADLIFDRAVHSRWWGAWSGVLLQSRSLVC